ncbi:hypothetical protein D3C75_969380 [compost metagenome]
MAFGGQDGIDPPLADPLFQPAMLVGQGQLASRPVFGHQIADEDDDGAAAADRFCDLAQQQGRHDGGEEAAGPQNDHVGLAQGVDRLAGGGHDRIQAQGPWRRGEQIDGDFPQDLIATDGVGTQIRGVLGHR